MPDWVICERRILFMTIMPRFLSEFRLLCRRLCTAHVLSSVRAGRLRALLLVPTIVLRT